MSRTYESVVIFDPTLTEKQIEDRVERFRGTLSGGDRDAAERGIFEVNHWGKRKLAYPIQKKEQGIYAVLRFEAEPEAVKEYDRIARLDEMVMRQLTVVNPPEVAAPAGKSAESGEEE